MLPKKQVSLFVVDHPCDIGHLLSFAFVSSDYKDGSSEAKVLNMFGVFIGIFCGLIVYLVTKYDYQRQSDDDHRPLSEN
jgi:hypothetical protein